MILFTPVHRTMLILTSKTSEDHLKTCDSNGVGAFKFFSLYYLLIFSPSIETQEKIVITISVKSQKECDSGKDWKSELKALDDFKTGVKVIVDSGAARVPQIFIHELPKLNDKSRSSDLYKSLIPLIDFQGIDKDQSLCCHVFDKVRDACEKWGFF